MRNLSLKRFRIRIYARTPEDPGNYFIDLLKFKYKKGLIRYASETAARQPWASHLGYGAAVIITIMFI